MNEQIIDDLKKYWYKKHGPNEQLVRISILNNEGTYGLATTIQDCLQKGDNDDDDVTIASYHIVEAANFPRQKDDLTPDSWNTTQIIVHFHPDSMNLPKNRVYVNKFLSVTGFDKSIVTHKYTEKLLNNADITLILGDDWNNTNANLYRCRKIIN